MLDIHPPDHTPHTWRDFFIHIATIVVGLVIAIGLEQTVEFIHHRHQRSELREALRQDNEKALRDDHDLEAYELAYVQWYTARMNDIELALHTGTPAHNTDFVPPYVKALPVDPNWKAARSSNLVEVLPRQDITAYAEVSDLINSLGTLYQSTVVAQSRLNSFEQQFQNPFTGKLDFSAATRQDLVQDLSLLSDQRSVALRNYQLTLYLRGCLTSVLKGERNLDHIDDVENHVEEEALRQLHLDDIKNRPKMQNATHPNT